MAALWRRYLALLGTHPYTTKSVTAAGIMAGGDFICQTLESRARRQRLDEQLEAFPHRRDLLLRKFEENDAYDVVRTARMTGFGLVFVGPLMHNWFNLLERLVPRKDLLGAVGKVAIDQAVMAPGFCASFFTAMGLMEGLSPAVVWEKLKAQMVPTLEANYKVWPAAQMVNLYLVPLNLRVLWLNMVGLGFNSYLSMVNNKGNIAREIAELQALDAQDGAAHK